MNYELILLIIMLGTLGFALIKYVLFPMVVMSWLNKLIDY